MSQRGSPSTREIAAAKDCAFSGSASKPSLPSVTKVPGPPCIVATRGTPACQASRTTIPKDSLRLGTATTSASGRDAITEVRGSAPVSRTRSSTPRSMAKARRSSSWPQLPRSRAEWWVVPPAAAPEPTGQTLDPLNPADREDGRAFRDRQRPGGRCVALGERWLDAVRHNVPGRA